MSSKQTYFAMLTVLLLLVAAIVGSTYLANKQLQKQSATLLDYKLQSQVLTSEETGLAKAKKDVATYLPLEKIAKNVVPQDKDQAQAVREIVNIAAASGIQPTAITFPVSTLGAGILAAPTTGTGTSTPATTTPSASSKASLSQLTPVKGMKGVYNLQITIEQGASAPVPYSKFLDFLSRLEQNRRTSQVTGIVLQPVPQNRTEVSFTLTVNEFIKP